MRILPSHIEQSGPGIDLTNLPEGLSVRMADPVKDFAYTRNAVTLVFDLSGFEHVRLAFAAMEFGDEPHEPPPGPFGDDADFDGVAISADGASWYEVQDLRHLRSDRHTAYDLDLDAAVAALGLSYNGEFRVRFCQYDNNPAPMDGIFLHGIELTAEPIAPVFHLPLDDNGPEATVRDLAPGGLDQAFLDPTGDPSTAAHSVPGPHGTTALSFDGVDDRIDFGSDLLGDLVGEGRDFTLALWYRTATGPGPAVKTFFRREASTAEPYIKLAAGFDRFYWRIGWGEGQEFLLSNMGMCNDAWHHLACRRAGGTLTLWVDGTVHETKTDPNYTRSFSCETWDPRAIGQVYGAAESNWPFSLADLRVYSRALRDEEIIALANP